MSDLEVIQSIVDDIYQRHKDNSDGEVAQYIPELANADPEPFGIAISTINNELITAGDVETPFSIQSVSKPFVFGLAIDECGEEKTFNSVGTEPSGEAFNAIELHPETSLPYNPMVNSGAIAMTSLIYDKYKNETQDTILNLFSELAGETIQYDESVYQSEIDTSARNKALTYLMQSVNAIEAPVEEKLQAYIKQCSANVNARQLSVMGATLANIGKNPITGNTIYDPLTVRKILSVMFTCGMYDFAGKWAVDVGLPAKSGVSGGVLAVVNRQIGIGIYSPRLDEHGNSVRAIAACIDLAEELGLHMFEFTNKGSSMLGYYIE